MINRGSDNTRALSGPNISCSAGHGTGFRAKDAKVLLGTGGDSLPSLRVANLRVNHSSLTLRPHAQHGFSITRPRAVRWTRRNASLEEYVLAAIRIPEASTWALKGRLADVSFMFPSSEADHTYGLLQDRRVQRALDEIVSHFRLPNEALGTLSQQW